MTLIFVISLFLILTVSEIYFSFKYKSRFDWDNSDKKKKWHNRINFILWFSLLSVLDKLVESFGVFDRGELFSVNFFISGFLITLVNVIFIGIIINLAKFIANKIRDRFFYKNIEM